MSHTWHSLFLPMTDPDAVTVMLHEVLVAHGYTAYDPFPGGTGTPPRLTAMVRHFVAPAAGGWVRVLGEPDPDTLLDFHTQIKQPVIAGWLTEDGGGFALLAGGVRHTEPGAFTDFIHPDHTLDTLRSAFEGSLRVEVIESEGPPVAVLGADSIPPELQAFAQQQGVDAKKANKLVERLGEKLLGRFSGGEEDDEAAQAHAMLAGAGGGDLWNSLHGQRVRAIASVLNLPANWRVPSWQQVRDAYQVFRLRKRSPRMLLMPGDQEAMNTVPDALDYTPVYMGRTDQPAATP